MLKYSEDHEAYIFEAEDMIICWDEDPGSNYEKTAITIKTAYSHNVTNIAKYIFDELKDVLNLTDIEDVISKLGRPQINPDIGQVVYCENIFDGSHIISFEYYDDKFEDIDLVTIDG